jgi:hypothetical protein
VLRKARARDGCQGMNEFKTGSPGVKYSILGEGWKLGELRLRFAGSKSCLYLFFFIALCKGWSQFTVTPPVRRTRSPVRSREESFSHLVIKTANINWASSILLLL